jgi:2-polyprenyl-3-methyl-5-hydroxy-6-metoxy-1,4-benzoquinol methylase
MCSEYVGWDEYYRKYPLGELGWELDKPRPILVEFVEAGLIPKGEALDTCCGAGTNPIYLARNGFNVTRIDVSLTAIGIAREKAGTAKVDVRFVNQSFVDLAFKDGAFDFVLDMGCFHHVQVGDRGKFIAGIHRVLREGGVYMLTCFSYGNGKGWNHFTRQQIADLFSDLFTIQQIRHYPSMEGDGYVRFFYTALMKKKPVST